MGLHLASFFGSAGVFLAVSPKSIANLTFSGADCKGGKKDLPHTQMTQLISRDAILPTAKTELTAVCRNFSFSFFELHSRIKVWLFLWVKTFTEVFSQNKGSLFLNDELETY